MIGMDRRSFVLSGFLLLQSGISLAGSPVRDAPSRLPSYASGVEIAIFGIGSPVDGQAVREVQRLIGQAVGSAIVDHYFVRRYGIEGGFSACAQKSPFALQHRFATLIARLNALQPNPVTTSYQVQAVLTCDDTVMCARDVKACVDGSNVTRVPPHCAFAPCSGQNDTP